MLQAIIVCNFKEKKWTKLDNSKKLISGPILACLTQIWAQKLFSWILSPLDVRHCCKLSLYAISKKTNEPNLRRWQKPSFAPPPFGLNLDHQFFFFQNLALSVIRYRGQLSSCTISEKTNGPILRKVNDGQTHELTDKSDFTRRCLTSSSQQGKRLFNYARIRCDN